MMVAMWCILDKFIFSCSTSYISVIIYIAIFKKKCELLKFSLSTRHFFFRFLFISVFFISHPRSCHLSLTSSKALASAFAYLEQPFLQVNFQSVNVCGDRCNISIQRCDSLLLLHNLECVVFAGIDFGTVSAVFCSGHR